MKEVPEYLSIQRAVARIVGLSGLGKTRLALEMFRPPYDEKDPTRAATTTSVIYASADSVPNLFNLLSDLRNERAEAIFVIDNCDLELHHRFSKIVRHPDSKLSLLTLDYDPNSIDSSERYIELGRFSDEVIKGILKQAYPGLQGAEIDRICSFAQGFPLMAIFLGDASLSDQVGGVALRDDIVLKRMVWGRDRKDAVGHNVLSACSLFDTVGVEGRVKVELEFIAREICQLDFRQSFEWIQRFKRRQLFQKRGDFVQVLPKPLALRLAAERWEEVHPDTAKSWFQGAMPDRLLTALCDQLANLDFHPSAQSFVKDLCGSRGPFGDSVVLNTEMGSRCFRSLVEANPHAAVEALDRAFGSWTTEQLLGVAEGRRHLVWALEKLCFRRETFASAARVLLSFAAAENETWGNNATGQFIHLYQLYLSGTEATGEEKLAILDEALRSVEPKRAEIAIEALGQGLTTGHFTRTGGAEEQGTGKRLEDWRPTLGEAREYLRSVLSRLTELATGTDKRALLARGKIAHSIRGLIGMGLIYEVTEAVNAITRVHGSYWPEALSQIADSLEFDDKTLPPEVTTRAELLYERLKPHSLEDRLRFYVTELPWGFLRRKRVTEEETAEIEALADECSRQPEFLLTQLPNLLTGSHRQFYPFGRRLGAAFPTPDRFIGIAVDFLKATDTHDANASLLGAFLSGLQHARPDLVQQTLDEAVGVPALRRHLVELTRLITIERVDIERIIGALRAKHVLPAAVRPLAYGSVLSSLAPEDVDPLLEALQHAGEEGPWVALDIVSLYVHGHKDRLATLRNRIAAILLTPGMLFSERKGSLDDHQFAELAVRLLQESDIGPRLAEHLAAEIVTVCRAGDSRYMHDAIKQITLAIFSRYADHVWPPFREAIATKDALEWLRLSHVLGPGFEKGEGKHGPLLTVPEERLLEWCRDEPNSVPAFIAGIAPLLAGTESDDAMWTPLVMRIMDEYGDSKDVLEAISGNMHTFSYAGSLVPYFQQYLQPLESLITHRHKAVRDFARIHLAAFREDINRETKHDEERDFGIY